MLILLPPSEGKTTPARGAALDLDALSYPVLGPLRRRVLDELISLCRRRPVDAMKVLGLSGRQMTEIDRNAQLPDVACAPAWQVYTGVLYDALDAASLDAAARRRLSSRVAVQSALFGLVRAGDRIPAYRLSGDVTLPKAGSLRELWRPAIQRELAATTGLVIDMRSSTYAALGPVPAELAERTVVLSVSQVKGGRKVAVSHHNKATKGYVVRALMQCSAAARDAAMLERQCVDAGFDVHLERGRSGPWLMDVLMVTGP